jgi:RNA polymerase sigma-70 factor (ECF subfamily)
MPPAVATSFAERRTPSLKDFAPDAGARRSGDADLCEALASAEPGAADALLRRLNGVVEATLARLVGPADVERDDLVQQSHERILASVVTRRFEGACSLSTWARVITEHVVIDALRSRARERSVFDGTCAAGDVAAGRAAAGPLPDELCDLRREIVSVQRSLDSVLPLRAQAFVLHDVLGFDLSEIADMLEISAAAAQSRLVRGRRDLHARIGLVRRMRD